MKRFKKWRVETLTRESFPMAVKELQEKIGAARFEPDAVLSIRRGGEFVGNLMFADVPHYAITLQRSSTKRKNGLFAAIIRHLPRFILDQMRIIEAWIAATSPTPALPTGEGVNFDLPILTPSSEGEDANLPPTPAGRAGEGLRLLIVDDAVDSGATLAAIKKRAEMAYPNADIRTAAITVTTQSPLIIPDFYLYHNFTLIRFPWSIDSKTPPK